jgi:hypothetical protein
MRGYEDRHSRFARYEEGLVSKLLGRAFGVNAEGSLALTAVTAGEHINSHAAPGERLGQGDGKRSFACAAGGEASDADDREAQSMDRLQSAAEPQFPQH